MKNSADFGTSILDNLFDGVTETNIINLEAVNTMLDKFGLNWTVSKQQLLLPTGKPSGFNGIVKDTFETDGNQLCFSTCKETYVPFQNSELAEMLIRISESTGYDIHSGGALNGGGKVYLQLDTKNDIKGLGKNKTTVKGYVTGINSHDGTTSLKWGAVNYTVCCRNTFARASKELQKSARHTASMREKVELSIMEINGIKKIEQTIFDQFKVLSNIPATRADIAKIIFDITEVDTTKTNEQLKIEKVTTNAINKALKVANSIADQMEEKGESLWGLFSGVTHYTSHVMTVPERENARVESKYTGGALGIDNVAFASILQMAK